MAEILAGLSGHTSYAPLSGEQTLQVCQYLHDLIKDNASSINTLKAKSNEHDQRFADMDLRLKANEKAVHDMREAFMDVLKRCDAMHKEIQMLTMNSQRDMATIQAMQEKIDALNDALRLARAEIQKVHQAQVQSDSVVAAVRDTVEKRLVCDIERLNDAVRSIDTQLAQLRDTDQKLSDALRQQQDELRNLANNLQQAKSDISRMDSARIMMEQRLGDLNGVMKTFQKSLEENNHAVLRLHDDHESTKIRVSDNMTNIKNLNQFLGVVRTDVDKNASELNAEKRRLEEVSDSLEARRRSMERLDQSIRGVREQTNQLQMTTQVLNVNVSDAREIALQAQSEIDSTNQIVLPNLVKHGLSPATGRPCSPPKTPIRASSPIRAGSPLLGTPLLASPPRSPPGSPKSGDGDARRRPAGATALNLKP